MTRHDDALRLRHMLDHALEAMEMVRGRAPSELAQNRMLELALVRLVGIVGEAAAWVSPDTRALYPDLPWAEIIGMRNRIVHGYDEVDLDILWNTIVLDLPPLAERLTEILSSRK